MRKGRLDTTDQFASLIEATNIIIWLILKLKLRCLLKNVFWKTYRVEFLGKIIREVLRVGVNKVQWVLLRDAAKLPVAQRVQELYIRAAKIITVLLTENNVPEGCVWICVLAVNEFGKQLD